jgi:predicted SnoaL-like aldol condensation-catalyzing enzyme
MSNGEATNEDLSSAQIPALIAALVLEAFDTLFNKRNYAKAERYWSPNYIQHSAHIPPGCKGLFDLVKTTPASMR